MDWGYFGECQTCDQYKWNPVEHKCPTCLRDEYYANNYYVCKKCDNIDKFTAWNRMAECPRADCNSRDSVKLRDIIGED